jgi:hypothetical protein
MAEPTDMKLYNETKDKVDKIYDKPSAYRSMAYTRFYLRAYREKYGNDKKAYKGKKPGELEKWRRDKWLDVRSFVDTPKDPKACGSIEYGKDEYPLCMPESKLKRYSKNELITFLNRKAELGKKRLVKESFLRDLGATKPEKVKSIKIEEPKKARGRPATGAKQYEKKVKEPKEYKQDMKEFKIPSEPILPKERKVRMPKPPKEPKPTKEPKVEKIPEHGPPPEPKTQRVTAESIPVTPREKQSYTRGGPVIVSFN